MIILQYLLNEKSRVFITKPSNYNTNKYTENISLIEIHGN